MRPEADKSQIDNLEQLRLRLDVFAEKRYPAEKVRGKAFPAEQHQ